MTIHPAEIERSPQKPAEKTLLLVDDEPNILSALKRVLRRDGYHIFSANSGRFSITRGGVGQY